jgi:hypothetical protein
LPAASSPELLGKSLFDFVWGRISKEEAPEPEHRDAPLGKLTAALALEGAIFRVTRGLAERGSRATFQRATGSWPGEERPEPA